MFDFFEKILGYVIMAVEFLLQIIESLITALGMVASVVVLPPVIAGYMPTVIASAVMITMSIAVVKFIIGR